MGAMFISARTRLPAKPLARALDAALAFGTDTGPLAGIHCKLTTSGLVILGSDGTGVCVSTVSATDSSGLTGRWFTVPALDAEHLIDWLRTGTHPHLVLKIGHTAISLVPPTGASLQVTVTAAGTDEPTTDVRDNLLRSLAAIAHDWAPSPAVPADLMLRLAEVQHLGSAAAAEVQLVPTANGWAGSFGDGATVFACATRRSSCDAPAVLAHVAATGTRLAAAGPTVLDTPELALAAPSGRTR